LESSYIYKAFGLVIQSEFECPELIPTTGTVDVLIKLGEVQKTLKNPLFSGVRFQTNGQEFLLQVDKIARYLVQNGRLITIDIFQNADLSEVRLFLLGSAFGALIHQRGLLPFHGSSVKVDNSAIILSGLSGAGKSTIAAALNQKGFPLLSDDVSVISFTNDGEPIVYPGYPQMKLWSDSIIKLGHNPTQYSRIRQQLEKHSIPLTTCYWDKPLPLSRIFIINSSNLGELNVESVKGVEKFSLLKTHTYRFNFVVGQEMNSLHFKSFDQLSKKVEVYKLNRPSGKFLFDELINLILHG